MLYVLPAHEKKSRNNSNNKLQNKVGGMKIRTFVFVHVILAGLYRHGLG